MNKEKAELLGMEKRSFLEGNYELSICFPYLVFYFQTIPDHRSQDMLCSALLNSSLLPLGQNITIRLENQRLQEKKESPTTILDALLPSKTKPLHLSRAS